MRSPRTTAVVSVFCVLTALAPAAWAQDPFPVYAVTFFNLQGCPEGWEPYQEAFERFLVPMASAIGTQVPSHPAPPMGSHWHRFTSSLSLPPLSYALATVLCTANCVSAAGDHPVFGETFSRSNLPFVQLFACIKTDEDPAGTIPPGLMSYFFRPRCPKRWSQVTTASGRFVVGLPGQGIPGATFGGPPLGSLEIRKHTHRVSGSLTTTIQEVAAASVGLADGYGLHGTYSFGGTTEESSYDIWRYLQLLLCSKDP